MNNIDSNKVIFYFCVPNYFWKKILVTKNSNISCLNRYLDPEYDFIYIYNGNIIDPNLTFENIGILEEEPIFSIKNDLDEMKNLNYNIKWMKLSCDPAFINRLKLISNKNTKNEYNRLKDIKNLKIEGNYKLFKKQSHNIYTKTSNEEDSTNSF